jgi:hypothetical protein
MAHCILITAGTVGLVERYVGVLDDVRGERSDTQGTGWTIC